MEQPKRITLTRKPDDPFKKLVRNITLEPLLMGREEFTFIPLPVNVRKDGKLVNRFNVHMRNIAQRECKELGLDAGIKCRLSEYNGKKGVSITIK